MKNKKTAPKKVHKEFTSSPEFVKACKDVGIPPTTRQASKWSNKKGKAYKAKHG